MVRAGRREECREDRFEAFYVRHYPAIYAYVHRRLVGLGSEVGDVVADVFSVAWRRLDEVPDAPQDRLWLYAVARRCVARARRSSWRRWRLHKSITESTQDLGDIMTRAYKPTVRSNRRSEMPRRLLLLVAAASLLVAVATAAPATADQSPVTNTFFNCTGPEGTPATFMIEKYSLEGTAAHIVGTNETFTRQGEFDLTTNTPLFGPPAGLVSSGLMATCEAISPVTGDLLLIYGKIAQTSP
jgi:DNA-directed RNA polymerase specialized sigma24 family protein